MKPLVNKAAQELCCSPIFDEQLKGNPWAENWITVRKILPVGEVVAVLVLRYRFLIFGHWHGLSVWKVSCGSFGLITGTPTNCVARHEYRMSLECGQPNGCVMLQASVNKAEND